MPDPVFTVAAFYKFVALDDLETLKLQLGARGDGLDLKGTILLAAEGINATISAAPDAMEKFLGDLRSDPRFADLIIKVSHAARQPFGRFKVKVKPEIVTFGAPEADPSRATGIRVAPENWNALIASGDVVVIDTRNAYEVAAGTFKGALDPGTRAFSGFKDFAARELDPAQMPKVAMFCTGGIRCEKASAYLRHLGFPEVYQLDGGILNYLEKVPAEASLWQGECFVFDRRVTVDHDIKPGAFALCRGCGQPFSHSGSDTHCPGCSPASV